MPGSSLSRCLNPALQHPVQSEGQVTKIVAQARDIAASLRLCGDTGS